MPIITTDEDIRALLTSYRRIAVVGLSDKPLRDSFGVAAYLQRQGYTIYPVNPGLVGQSVLGQPVYGSLAEIPEIPEIVDVFRRSEFVMEVATEAIAVGAQVLWTQLGVRDDEAAKRASEAGLSVVQDRCMEIEHSRLGIGQVR